MIALRPLAHRSVRHRRHRAKAVARQASRPHRATRARRLWRTLVVLALQPGRLTTLHLRGVRARFASPFGLYLLTGLVFLGLFKFLTDGPRVAFDQIDFNLIFRPRALCTVDTVRTCGALDRLAIFASKSAPDRLPMPFMRALLHRLPYFVFLLSPSFAAVVALFNHDRPIGFAGHLAFSLHLHAFCFLIAALTLLLPVNLTFAALVVAPGYALCALHEVYAGRWYRTALGALGILAVHLVTLGALAAGALRR